jgi:hypothetical protein
LWLARPSAWTAAQFGIAAALSLCAKFSTLAFLPTCATAIVICCIAARQMPWRALLRTLPIAILCTFLVTWAVYRFSHVPLAQETGVPDRLAANVFGPSSMMTGVVHGITARLPLPAPELLEGVRMMREQHREGTISYLFGQVRYEGGWWYFFLVALALKTPLAVLVLAALGTIAAVSRYWRDWEVMAPIVSAIVILIVTAPSGLNSGVRYVMPMFALLSILAGIGLTALWTRPNKQFVCRTAAVFLAAWLLVSSVRAHPDYLAYFNEFGGKDPSRLLVISDLDWGQDLTRLAAYLRQQNVKHITIAYDGFYEPHSLDLPDTYQLPWECKARASGLTAVEIRRVRLHPQCFTWLAGYQPITLVGKTMWIYQLPEAKPAATLENSVP